jgi:hypothetical protein
VTTTLTDKQLQAAYETGRRKAPNRDTNTGLRAVADLAITQADSEIHGLREDLVRLQMALKEAQAK